MASFTVLPAVTPQATTMYYGQLLEAKHGTAAATPTTVTQLIVFTGTAPAGMCLVGVEGNEPYADEMSASKLINRLLLTGCGTGSACTAVNCTYFEPRGTRIDFVVMDLLTTDHLYLSLAKR